MPSPLTSSSSARELAAMLRAQEGHQYNGRMYVFLTLAEAKSVAEELERLADLEAAIRKLEVARETDEGQEFGFNYVPVENAYDELLAALEPMNEPE